jgi:hypothetical protein
MPFCRTRFYQIALFGFLLLPVFAMQGCLGIIWLGAVGTDWARTSDVTFQPFENSWVGRPLEGPSLGFVKRITIRPFTGDPMMAERWTMVLQDLTDRRVESQGSLPGSTVSDIECTLIGNVIDLEPQSSLMGLKETSAHRLYLRLMTTSGALLWKTELPYTIEKGTKDLDEKRVMNALLVHVRVHATEIGLAGLGATPMQVALHK